MQANHTTQVVVLDGSKAMRNLSTNNMNAMLEVRRIEETSQGSSETKDEQARIRQNETEWKKFTEVCRKAKGTGDVGMKSHDIQQVECSDKGVDERNAPVFASFSDMDLLDKGIKKQFSSSRCIGGSEINSNARVLFEREHGFAPFKDHRLDPRYAYEKVFLVTTGAPCVVFSMAGKQNGQADARGCQYADQVDAYTQADVPVILFEQVPEARRVLPSDQQADRKGRSPQQQLVEKVEAGGYMMSTWYLWDQIDRQAYC